MREYLVTTDITGKYIIKTLSGFNALVKPSDVKKIISDLNEYCKNYTDDEVDIINSNIEEHFFDSVPRNKDNVNKKQLDGYIYLLKCGDFYKIGYSKCVETRIRQLDVRPYKIELLMKWKSKNAYTIEQALHQIYNQYSVDNEWYSHDLPIRKISKTIQELEATIK